MRREKVTSLTFSGTEQTQSSLTQEKELGLLNQYLHGSAFMCMQHPITGISSSFKQIHESKTSMLASNPVVENPLDVNSESASRLLFHSTYWLCIVGISYLAASVWSKPLVAYCWHQLPGSLCFSHPNSFFLLKDGICYKATDFTHPTILLSTVDIDYQPQFLWSNQLIVNCWHHLLASISSIQPIGRQLLASSTSLNFSHPT